MQFLLILLIFTIPLGVLTRVNIYSNVYLYLQDIIVGLIFVLFIYKLFKKKVNFINKKIFYSLLGFIILGFISLVINSQFLNPTTFLISFLYLLRFSAYASLIFVVSQFNIIQKKKISRNLLVAGLLFTFFGFIQYFYYQNLRNLYYAGWDDHLYRLFSTLLDPNFTGIVIVLAFILSFYSLLVMPQSFNKWKVALIAVSIAEVVAIYLTYSRSAFVAFIVGVMVLLILLNKKIILIPVVIIMVTGLIIFSNVKIEGLNPFRTASSIARVATTREAIDIFEKNAIIGVGFDALRYAQVRYGYRNDNLIVPSNADAGTDNSFLFILVTTGLLGFLFYTKFMFELVKNLFVSIKNFNDSQSVLVLSSLFAVIGGSMFINALFYPTIMAWMFILIGTSVGLTGKKK